MNDLIRLSWASLAADTSPGRQCLPHSGKLVKRA